MKSLFLICTLSLVSLSSFGFSRVIECNSNINYNLKLSILIDPGVATVYSCMDSPCSRHEQTKVAETAEVKSADPKTYTLHYVVKTGNFPAESTLDITFPRAPHTPTIVAFDGDDSLYSCY